MKCPNCGSEEDQQQLSPDERGQVGYRCAVCGRLYEAPAEQESDRNVKSRKNGARR